MPINDINKYKTCCFRGIGPKLLLESREEIQEVLNVAIQLAIDEGYINFITGAERGFESWAADTIIRYKATFPGLKLFSFLPYPERDCHWKNQERIEFDHIIKHSDMVKIISEKFTQVSTYYRHARSMADNSTLCIAYYDGNPWCSVADFFFHSDEVKKWNIYDVMKKRGDRRDRDTYIKLLNQE